MIVLTLIVILILDSGIKNFQKGIVRIDIDKKVLKVEIVSLNERVII